MKTHLIALAIAVTVTGLAIGVVNTGMRDGAERARLANTEIDQVIVTAQRRDAQVATAATTFTF